VKPPRLVEGGRGPCPDSASYTLAFALQLRKITENLSQGSRKALGRSVRNAIRLVDLAIEGDGLDWPASPCRPWLSLQATGSTLGQRKYLPSCRTRAFPTSTNFESKLAVRALMWSANSGTPRSSCILPLTYVPGDPSSKAKTLGLYHLSLPIWVRGKHNPSRGCLYSRTPFLTERSLFLFRRGPSIPIL
jgi:hypothetical protein